MRPHRVNSDKPRVQFDLLSIIQPHAVRRSDDARRFWTRFLFGSRLLIPKATTMYRSWPHLGVTQPIGEVSAEARQFDGFREEWPGYIQSLIVVCRNAREGSQMVVRRIAHCSLVIAMHFAVSTVAAQTSNPAPGASAGGKFRAVCGAELQRFCAGVQPGGGRLVECLSYHTPELSGECGNLIAAGRGGAELRATCGEDLQRFCSGVQPGGGRFVTCLSFHTRELSAACGNLIAVRNVHRGIPNPSAQSPAAQSAAPTTVASPPVVMGSILRASCGPDVQKLCFRARNESDALKCLDSRRKELSTTCNVYFQKLGARPAAQMNTPIKKPPSPLATTPPASPPHTLANEKSDNAPKAETSQSSQLDDKPDPVIERAKAAIAAKMENPASVEFGEMKRADRKNADGKLMDSICGYVRVKTASGGEIKDRPFLYLVKEDQAYIGGYGICS